MNWITGLHPDLIDKIGRVLSAMASEGHPMRVCQGLRSVEMQQALYAQGRTAPGKIVTNCDGVRNRSNHQPHVDGYGHAVDCCFTTGEPFGDHQPWSEYGAKVVAAGLVWGGSWVHLPDRPHAELA